MLRKTTRKTPEDHGDSNHAEFTSLTIRDKGQDSSVYINASGIWVSNKSGEVMASIQMDNGQPVLAVADHRKPVAGHQLALTVDKEGAPCLQIVCGDKVAEVSAADLFRVFAPK